MDRHRRATTLGCAVVREWNLVSGRIMLEIRSWHAPVQMWLVKPNTNKIGGALHRAAVSKAEFQLPCKRKDSVGNVTVLAWVAIAYCNFMSPSATVFASASSGPSGPEPLIGRSTEHQRGFGAVLVPMFVQPGAPGLQYVPGSPTG